MKKRLFAIALVISLVAILSVGSLAWFTDTDAVTNNFMIATSDDDTPDEIFSVDAYEIDPEGNEDQDGLEFTDILPGDHLAKDARVRNTGYYDQYIRVVVTISDAQAWQAVLGNSFNDDELRGIFYGGQNGGFNEADWRHITTEVYNNGTADDTSDDVIRIVMYYKDIVPGRQNANYDPDFFIQVFEQVNIPPALNRDNATLFGGDGFTINVRADAVQTENLIPDDTAEADRAILSFHNVGWMEDFPDPYAAP